MMRVEADVVPLAEIASFEERDAQAAQGRIARNAAADDAAADDRDVEGLVLELGQSTHQGSNCQALAPAPAASLQRQHLVSSTTLRNPKLVARGSHLVARSS